MRQIRSMVGASVRRNRKTRGARPRLEALEGRVLLASQTFTVTNINDSGDHSLRWAITQANDNPGADTIAFDFGDSQPVHTIQPLSPLPAVTDEVFLNGDSAASSPTTPPVVIDGSQITGSTADGLAFQPSSSGTNPTSPDNSTVRGLVIQHFSGSGVSITDANSISVFGCYIGTTADGSSAASNGTGILINNGASNTIGGTSSNVLNVVSGNVGDGISVQGASATGNVIQDNIIGLNAGASSAVSNGGNGIRIGGSGSSGTAASGTAASGTTIGGTTSNAGNTISGNTGAGVLITDGSKSNLVEFNLVGTDGTGSNAISNRVGVSLTGTASANTIGAANSGSGGSSLSGGNLISGNLDAGIKIDDSQKNLVIGNFIGTNKTGTAALGGTPSPIGILLTNNASNNTIGSAQAAQANVISGHSAAGVEIQGGSISASVSAANVIQGNFIGTDNAGTSAIPNAVGVHIGGAANLNTIGGSASGTRNVISGNSGAGVLLDTGASKNAIQGNLIGTQVNGSTALANGADGVKIDGASNNTIGATLTGAGNTIANNQGAGVLVLSGTGDAIRQNSIYANTKLGIDLGGNGVTPIHNPPLNSGPNLFLNYPTLDSAQSGPSSTTVSGSYIGLPRSTYTIEIYATDSFDPSGFGQGKTYLKSVTVTTDADGNVSFNTTVSDNNKAIPATSKITALAVDSAGNTSEFSKNVSVVAPKADVAVSMTVSAPASNQPNVAATGGLLVYTITVTNNGPDQVTDVSLTDTLPSGVTVIGSDAPYPNASQSTSTSTFTITVGTLNKGESRTYHLTVVAPSTVPTGNTLSNTVQASIASNITNTNPSGGKATATINIQAGIDLSVSSGFTPSQPVQGQETVIFIYVTNQSGTQATGVVLTDALPQNFTVDQITTTQGTVNPTTNGTFTVNLGTLPPSGVSGSGATARVAIYGKPTASYQFLTNVASVSASQVETQITDNTSAVTAVAVPSVADLATASTTTSAPTVEKLARTGFHRQPTRYNLTFSQAMSLLTTQNLANYRLVTAGRDRKFGTADDRRIPLKSAVYDPSTDSVGLTTRRPVGLRVRTRLTVNGSAPGGVSNASGVLLDGAGNGIPGSNYVAQIEGLGPVSSVNAAAVDALLSGRHSRRRKP